MVKKKRFLLSAVIAATLVTGSGGVNTFAAEDEDGYIDGPTNTYSESSLIKGPPSVTESELSLALAPTLPFDGYKPAFEDYTGWEYQKVTKSKSKKTYWDHDADNRKNSKNRVVHKTVERSIYTSSTASTSGSLKAVVAEVGVSLETSWGNNYRESTVVDYTVPPRERHMLLFGSRYVSSQGLERYYHKGKLKKKRSIGNKWTYTEFSDQYPI